jgi:ribosome-binding protein aMBF1 (putative translation factor)
MTDKNNKNQNANIEDFLKKILPIPNDTLAFGNYEDYKQFKKAKKNYETIEFNNFIGKIIKDRRKELNISPTDIASTLNITYRTYYSYENATINIPPENLFKITKILDISLDDCRELYFNIKKYKEDFKHLKK